MGVVQDIRDGMLSVIAAELGSTYRELDYFIDVKENNKLGNRKRYAVNPLTLNSEGGICVNITVDQEYEIVLTTDYINKSKTDKAQREATFLLYEKMFAVVKQLYLTKVGIPSKVMNVSDLVIDDPEYLDNEDVVVMRGRLSVKYRQQL